MSAGHVQPWSLVQTGGQSFFANFWSPESSGGWSREFTLEKKAVTTIKFKYRLKVDGNFDNEEYGEAVLTVDGVRYGRGPGKSLLRFNGNSDEKKEFDSGWREASIKIPLDAGKHTLVFGAYVNRSTSTDEIARAWFDNISLEVTQTR